MVSNAPAKAKAKPMSFQNLVRELVDAAYETGYYSGRQQDGQPHHLAAIERREALRARMLAAYEGKGEPEVDLGNCA